MLTVNVGMGYRLIVGGGDIMFLRNGSAANTAVAARRWMVQPHP
ncbi:MAG: hypothetical protein R3C45_02015 [Phycisphaerales bacterium]